MPPMSNRVKSKNAWKISISLFLPIPKTDILFLIYSASKWKRKMFRRLILWWGETNLIGQDFLVSSLGSYGDGGDTFRSAF